MTNELPSPDNIQLNVQPLGSTWMQSSLIWGVPGGEGPLVEQHSPIDGRLLGRAPVLSPDELERLLMSPAGKAPQQHEVWPFIDRLEQALAMLRTPLIEAMQFETAFTTGDCEELFGGMLLYINGFRAHLEEVEQKRRESIYYQSAGQARHIQLVPSSWGTIAIVLPQNAFLLIAITALLNALVTGNRIILRAPQQSARSAALLGTAIRAAGDPWNAVSVVMVRAREFLAAVNQARTPLLIHYMGSSQHAGSLMTESFQGGKSVLVDGSGNVWMWIDANVPVEVAVSILTAGATRYNGETCTSVNGAMIHPDLYPKVREHLVRRWQSLKTGNPLDPDVDIGPLFDEGQAAWCIEQVAASGGELLVGGERVGNLLQPVIVEHPIPESGLVREGLFGSGLWIASGNREDFVALWRFNRYPLCAGIVSGVPDTAWWLTQLPQLARLVVNGDPSIEHIYEPWGGYPQSGMNHVGHWHEKYQRIVAVDMRSGV